MQKIFVLFFSLYCLCICFGCQELIEAPVPPLSWEEFDATNAKSLTATERAKLSGVYRVTEGDYPFGKKLAAKWSYTINGVDTVWHLSFFGLEEATLFICQGKRKGDSVLLNGYWRKMVNTQTGRLRLKLPVKGFAQREISGWFGNGDAVPTEALRLQYQNPLHNEDSLLIIGHRGGGRSNDLLPASENSIEMLKLSSRLGATGVEIDVQLSKDGVPVLYHDANINDRLTIKAGIRGSIDDYTLQELKKIDLKRGGKIPTLQQALDTILYKTPLQFVWLDCKEAGNLVAVHQMQQAYMQKARQSGRKLLISIGISDEDMAKSFMALPRSGHIPSLTELDTSFARKLNADAWAPSWTKGKQLPEVKAMHAQGRKVFVWTVDMHAKIEEFINDGDFDGICSNRPGIVAYYHYTKEK